MFEASLCLKIVHKSSKNAAVELPPPENEIKRCAIPAKVAGFFRDVFREGTESDIPQGPSRRILPKAPRKENKKLRKNLNHLSFG
jgi:hypothetical protein